MRKTIPFINYKLKSYEVTSFKFHITSVKEAYLQTTVT